MEDTIIEHTKNNSKLFKELLELESDEENDKDETKYALLVCFPFPIIILRLNVDTRLTTIHYLKMYTITRKCLFDWKVIN